MALNIMSSGDWTPVSSASFFGHFEVVKLLLSSGADTTIPNEFGWTPLITAANKDHHDVAKLLLEYEANNKLLQV